MGPETLGEIRGKLRKALSEEGQDPIERLEQLIKERGSPPPEGKFDVLNSLKRFLESEPRTTSKKRKKRTAAKK